MRQARRRWRAKWLLLLASVVLALGWQAYGQSAGDSAAKPAATAAIPSADQILDRYVQATGGRAAWRKLTSRHSTGTIEAPALSMSGTIDIFEKAPNRVLAVIVMAGASFRQGFDGTVAWSDDPQNGLRELNGPELAETRRDADFYHPLDLRQLYSKFTVRGVEKVGEREAYAVEATPPEGGEPERVYFDKGTGLLLRLVSHRHSPEGSEEVEQDFEDYREVDGIMLPFLVRQTSESTPLTIRVSEVHHNVPMDDSQFAKPAVE